MAGGNGFLLFLIFQDPGGGPFPPPFPPPRAPPGAPEDQEIEKVLNSRLFSKNHEKLVFSGNSMEKSRKEHFPDSLVKKSSLGVPWQDCLVNVMIFQSFREPTFAPEWKKWEFQRISCFGWEIHETSENYEFSNFPTLERKLHPKILDIPLLL